jgi:ribonuclease VapC
MVIDTSAVVAILFDEPERADFIEKVESTSSRYISTSTLLECALVVEARKGKLGRAELELFVYEANLIVVPFDQAQLDFATFGRRTYGKGRHPAGLNYGDCFAYALAKSRNEPLLFKGNDFAQTGVELCR